ncbi:hypothetical protein [Buttiauxella noackiae]|uniref:hypothetical protein n=1 Tax=Buttiauxella noackiae TaxID=82992 RepID=UPI0028D54045|nr:hypothetical protein [Buttiauxella noackiae]
MLETISNIEESLNNCRRLIRLAERITFWTLEEIDTTKISTIEQARSISHDCAEFIKKELHNLDFLSYEKCVETYNSLILQDRNLIKFLQVLKISLSPFENFEDACLDYILRKRLSYFRHCPKHELESTYGPPVKEYLYWVDSAQGAKSMYYHLIVRLFYSRMVGNILLYQKKVGNGSAIDNLKFLRDYKIKLEELHILAKSEIFELNRLHGPESAQLQSAFNMFEIDQLIQKTESSIITKRQDDTLHERILASDMMILLKSCQVKNILSSINIFMGARFVDNIVEHRTLSRLWKSVKDRDEFEMKELTEREEHIRRMAEERKLLRKNGGPSLKKEVAENLNSFYPEMVVTKHGVKNA